MKNTEIGHFPYEAPKHEFHKGGYPRQLLSWNGKDIKWLPNWKILGEPPQVDIPEGTKFTELLIDLQTAHDCYCADLMVVNGSEYVHLQGSGWADCGFPFFDDTINEKDLFVTGNGCYALLTGKAKDNFVKLAKQDYIPSFNECFTGDIQKDFRLPK